MIKQSDPIFSNGSTRLGGFDVRTTVHLDGWLDGLMDGWIVKVWQQFVKIEGEDLYRSGKIGQTCHMQIFTYHFIKLLMCITVHS